MSCTELVLPSLFAGNIGRRPVFVCGIHMRRCHELQEGNTHEVDASDHDVHARSSISNSIQAARALHVTIHTFQHVIAETVPLNVVTNTITF